MAAQQEYDIVIAGGGMVGASLALLLSRHSDDQLRIHIVERFVPSQTNDTGAPVFQPSFDARSTALSYGSRLIFEALGIWPQLAEHIAPINSIHVGEQGRLGSVLMDRDEIEWPSLGYVIENAWLGNVLYAALRKKNNISFHCHALVSSIQKLPEGVMIDIQSAHAEAAEQMQRVTAQLAVVADGANSRLRKQLGIAAISREYGQTALIANVSFTRPHNGRAYERFTHEGPMALLPLNALPLSHQPAGDNKHDAARAALVWTLPAERARFLVNCEDKEFLQQLQQCFGRRQGEFIHVGERVCYPLVLIEAQEQVRAGIVIMGNAAHSLHPVAGQGFNLALRDCARLATVTATAKSRDEKIALGDLSMLNQYLKQQQFDQQKTVAFSDCLPALFSNRLWGASCLRALGLAALDVIPAAKKQFVHHAAGLHDGAALSYQSPQQ